MEVLTNKETSAVLLKGSGNGLRLIIPDDVPIDKVVEDARLLLKEASAMVSGMDIIVDTGTRPVGEQELIFLLQHLIWAECLRVSFWRCENSATNELISKGGFKLEIPPAQINSQDYDALVIDRSLRSGQRISHPGDVLVMGNVHDGAEVSANGNVCVFGRLSGVVHAGADGDDRRFITADNFNARQIRIGNKVSNDVDLSDHSWWGRPVIISVERGSFQITERK
nr:septum site-determining protein MinC [uncultured Dethiosulfovibrio sp.]